jgi:hypothetical protein
MRSRISGNAGTRMPQPEFFYTFLHRKPGDP